MNDAIKITILGEHRNEEQDTQMLQTDVEGEYFLKNGKHYILYKEESEEKRITKNLLQISKQVVRLSKTGLLHTEMIFEENQNHSTSYLTPYGEVKMMIHTKKIDLSEAEDFIKVCISYEILEQDLQISNCNITIEISSLPISMA